ncbi:MAG: response regulator [Treponema sp.]|nr:response regulator [Treponema sp.]
MESLRYKIALVDDNIATLNQGKSLLQAFYKVYTIQSAATLFENLEHDIPDLILLDVEMPDMDGFEVITKLKEDVRYKDIPVIFLTVRSDEESERKGFELGAVDYIFKPFSGPLLQKRISNQILYKRIEEAVKDYSDNLEVMVGEITKANERTKILLDKTPLCARLWDSKKKLIDCNEAAVKLFGFKDKQECLDRYSEVYPEFQPDGQRSVDKVEKCIEEAFRKGSHSLEWTYRMLDGTPMPAEVVLVKVQYEDDFAVAGYTRDLREHNKMMERVYEEEERMRLMLNAMPLACRLFGRNFKFIDCNQQALDLVGVTSKEEYQERFNEIIPEFQPCGRRSNELKMEYLDAAFEKGYLRFEWMYQLLDGTPLPCEVTMVRVMFKGEYIMAGYIRDLREQKALIEEMRRAEIAEESNKAKSKFLANMSHEIRTPMNSIMGFTELALDLLDERLAPEVEDYLNKINENAQVLLHIINDILDISKIESGKIELENIPFKLQEVLYRCQSAILPDVKEKELNLIFNTDPLADKIFIGDPIKLYQTFMNLLSNAVKFTNAGIIEFSTQIININHDKTTVRFVIKDSGIGMNTELIKKVLEPFVQGDSSTTRNYGGTGLGLAIANNIVDLMGGQLMIESSPGSGSSFSFEIPFKVVDEFDESPFGDKIKNIEKPYFDGLILICEDNPMNQDVVCEHLARVGLKTMVAENGRIGVEMVKERKKKGEKPFDLIFMDMFMPVMDGLEATSKIMAMDTKTPIVAMTANIMPNDLGRYKKQGVIDCLGKPFTSQELWYVLLKYLSPVKNEGATGPINDNEKDDALQKKLRNNFFKIYKTIHTEITDALTAGDIKLAHRLAHSLKGNAGLLGKTALRNAAAEIETLLKEGVESISENKMNILERELITVIEELRPLIDESAVQNNIQSPHCGSAPDTAQVLALFKKLEPMLFNVNSECIDLLDDIRAVPGTQELVRQIEDFNFKDAADTLLSLKEKWDSRHE